VVLSKRERYIGYVTGAVLALVLVQYVVVGPLWERKTQLDARIADAKSQRDRDNGLIETSERAGKYWTQMSSRSLPRDSYDADQMLNNLSDWAQDAGLSLSSVKSERTEKEKDFYKKTFRAAGSGGMRQVGQFLYRIQTASTAARITDVTLSSRKEGTDDLSVSVGVATIYPVPESEKTRLTASIAEVSR
jgi:Tfp pilus assembly protein PilO